MEAPENRVFQGGFPFLQYLVQKYTYVLCPAGGCTLSWLVVLMCKTCHTEQRKRKSAKKLTDVNKVVSTSSKNSFADVF